MPYVGSGSGGGTVGDKVLPGGSQMKSQNGLPVLRSWWFRSFYGAAPFVRWPFLKSKSQGMFKMDSHEELCS